MLRLTPRNMILVSCLITTSFFSCSREVKDSGSSRFEVMGTVARLEIPDSGADLQPLALTRVQAAFDSVNTLMSTWDPHSEISRLNSAPADSAMRLSPWLSSCLHVAETVQHQTGGAFDPCAESLMRLWGFYRRQGRLPSEEELAAALATRGQYTHDPVTRTLIKHDPHTHFDLGGIAKGFAVDRAVEQLHSLGITDALVDLGGNLYCLGGARDKSHWRVGVVDPLDREKLFAVVSLRNRAVATSGSYERFVTIEGRRYGHIMNPATGRPAQGLLSATVISGEAELSDALSTALFVLGPEKGLNFLESCVIPGIDAILVLPAGQNGKARVLVTRGLQSNFQLLPQYRESYSLEFLDF